MALSRSGLLFPKGTLLATLRGNLASAAFGRRLSRRRSPCHLSFARTVWFPDQFADKVIVQISPLARMVGSRAWKIGWCFLSARVLQHLFVGWTKLYRFIIDCGESHTHNGRLHAARGRSRSEKLLILTAPSGNRATTSSSPPMASM